MKVFLPIPCLLPAVLTCEGVGKGSVPGTGGRTVVLPLPGLFLFLLLDVDGVVEMDGIKTGAPPSLMVTL
jgi:hypothetical protein